MNGQECQRRDRDRDRDPMRNDSIVERIFQFCDVSSLKNIRLVSPKWRDLSLKTWRKKAMIELGPASKLKFHEFLELIDPESNDNDSLQLRKRPFKCYSVQLNDGEQDEDQDEDAFLEQKRIAVAISHSRARFVNILWNGSSFNGFSDLLSIVNSAALFSLQVTWSTLDSDVPEESMVARKCSSLKRLKLYTRSMRPNHSPKRSLCSYLLRCYPKLEALTISYGMDVVGVNPDYTICLDERLQIVCLLKELRDIGGENTLPLKELDMIDVYGNHGRGGDVKEGSIIRTLAACNFSLERLSIHIEWHGNSSVTNILQLLESCKDTLQYLKMSVNFDKSFVCISATADKWKQYIRPEPSQFRMSTLTEVCLVNGLESGMFFLGHLDIPQLQKLIIQFEIDRNPCQEDQHDHQGSHQVLHGKVYNRLETLELHDNRSIPDEMLISMLQWIMPNLTHLKIPLDKSSFVSICSSLKGLKTLHVLPSQEECEEIDDTALTGCCIISGGPPAYWTTGEPNITDLEHLSDFRISCEKQLQRNDIKFTEQSVTFGFLKLPRLHHLSIAIKDLSLEMKKRLVSHVKGNVHLQQKRTDP